MKCVEDTDLKAETTDKKSHKMFTRCTKKS